jgi:hypothetical protein
VAAVLAADGSYLRTDVRAVRSGRTTSVWLESGLDARRAGRRGDASRVVLNPTGAGRADGAPSVAEHPLTGLPWAVWAYNEGGDYELAFAFFDGGTREWIGPILLGGASNGVADMEPTLAFSPDGRPLVAWWRMSADGSEQSVWFTSRQNGVWMPPARLSSARENARKPALALTADSLIVAFETDRGVRIRTFPAASALVGGFEPAGGADGPDPPTYDDTRPPECQFIGCNGD